MYHQSNVYRTSYLQVWRLYNERKTSELLDDCLFDSCVEPQVLRFIQIGLLCVQEYAIDRPDMSSVVFMLNNENSTIPAPKRPGFCKRRNGNRNMDKNDMPTSSSISNPIPCSTNMVTFTTKDGR